MCIVRVIANTECKGARSSGNFSNDLVEGDGITILDRATLEELADQG
jgi:hypothetical protein